jgi:hypothetical protein
MVLIKGHIDKCYDRSCLDHVSRRHHRGIDALEHVGHVKGELDSTPCETLS